MTLHPAPPVLGSEAAGGGGTDVAERVRATAQQEWLGRRALERQLHDGAALRISALVLRLGLLRHDVPGAGSGFGEAVEGVQDELHLVLQELRDVAGMLYPPLLDQAGLGPALREVAARCPVPVRVEAPDERFGPAAEGAAYFALLGCLPHPDTARPHPAAGAGAPDGVADGIRARGPVDVVVRRDGDELVLLVSGVDARHAETVHDGVRSLGGTVSVGVAGRGIGGAVTGDAHVTASIAVRIPCA
jgi:hypothetical protein